MGSDLDEIWWKLFLQTSRTFLNPPKPPKTSGDPKFRDQDFDKKQEQLTKPYAQKLIVVKFFFFRIVEHFVSKTQEDQVF